MEEEEGLQSAFTSVETAHPTRHRVTVDDAVLLGRCAILRVCVVVHANLDHKRELLRQDHIKKRKTHLSVQHRVGLESTL